MSSRLEKFKSLKSRRVEAESENKKELYKEHQRNKTDFKKVKALEKSKQAAELELQKLDGNDREILAANKKQLWNYSVEDNEVWEEKMADSKANKAGAHISDYNTLAHKTYVKSIKEMDKKRKGETNKINNYTEYGYDHKPSQVDVELYTGVLKQKEAARIQKNKIKSVKNGKDSMYINQKNKDFNGKLARHYDKYTKEIRDKLE